MKNALAALLLCLFAVNAADARCWKSDQNVSWYFDKNTASGEHYSTVESTCAHRTLPFGTRVRVTEKRSHRSTVCRVNDRGPNKWTKCQIDVNVVAARKLGITRKGVASARIEVATADGSYVPLVEKARAYIGQTAAQIGVRRNLWCSAFLRAITHAGGVDDRARSWLVKQHVSPSIGTIVVLTRGGGGSGHVGVVSGFDGHGNPIVISGNHGRRVGEGVYPKSRVIAYVSAG